MRDWPVATTRLWMIRLGVAGVMHNPLRHAAHVHSRAREPRQKQPHVLELHLHRLDLLLQQHLHH